MDNADQALREQLVEHIRKRVLAEGRVIDILSLESDAAEIEETDALSTELFEKAIAEYPEGSTDTWLSWIKAYPATANEAPSADTVLELLPAPLAALTRQHLCRRAWREGVRDYRLRNLWFDAELAEHNVGTVPGPPNFTARWIVQQEDWVGEESGEIDPSFVNRWVDLELKDNSGNFSEPSQYTARWIFRWAWNRGFRGSSFLIKWLELEKRSQNISAEDDWSVRNICRRAWAAGVRNTNFLGWWIRFEAEQENERDLVDPQEYTARWICRSAWEENVRDLIFLLNWLDFEESQHNLGSVDNPDKYSARWIYRNAWRGEHSYFGFLVRWFILEHAHGNIGDDNSPHTAAWIDKLVLRHSPSNPGLSLGPDDKQRYLEAGGKLQLSIRAPIDATSGTAPEFEVPSGLQVDEDE